MVEAAEVVVVAIAEDEEPVKLRLLHKHKEVPDIEVPNILTFPKASGRGARCTISGAGVLSFVANPPPARGRTYSHQSHETGTSPTKI